jgi:iron complex outermembrane receptor protein
VRVFVVTCVLFLKVAAPAAQTATVDIEVRADAEPAGVVDVFVNGVAHKTDSRGQLSLTLPVGHLDIVVVKEGFAPASVSVDVQANQRQPIVVALTKGASVEEHVTVSATRTDKRIEDEPMRVDVLDKEDLEEEQAQTPGDIVMVLSEKAGIHVQSTSPGLGTASIRIQGMRGRYTRVLSDGLPLFGEDVGGLSLLQTPPSDLAQVELIKGTASALYGAGALGGVIDLISRRPDATPARQVLINRSSLGATDAVLFATQPISDRWSGTLLVGGHWQQLTDVEGDGWADLPGYSRGVVRPRLFWDDKKGDTVFVTGGVTVEHRSGGTMPGAAPAPIDGPFVDGLDTRRFDAGVVAQTLLAGQYVLSARSSATWQRQAHQYGGSPESDQNNTAFGEVSLRGRAPRQTWVGGVAFERDTFNAAEFPAFAYSYNVPALFGQDDIDVARWLSISASGRLDAADRFGTFFSPRLSALVRGNRWNSRASIGTGFFTPTPLTDETEAAGLARLKIPVPLTVERGQSESWDLTRVLGPVSITGTLFHSQIKNPMVLDRVQYVLTNATQPTDNTGVELLGTYHLEDDISVTSTYTYVRAIEGTGADRGEVPLTPRHSVGVFGVWEVENAGRVALEWYYTGRQRLEDNPYRTQSAPYIQFGALVERRFGRLRLFLNAENLGNVRQTNWDPLIRPTRAVDGRWTVDAWAPLDGRVINGGLKVGF